MLPNGSVSVHEVKCPSCGAPLQLAPGATSIRCSFCGSSFTVSYQQRRSDVDPDGTIRDRATGYGLFRARIANGWQVAGTALARGGSSSRPYIPKVEFHTPDGGVVRMQAGDAGTRQSAAMRNLVAMYGGAATGLDQANYADMPDPIHLTDAYVAQQAGAVGEHARRCMGPCRAGSPAGDGGRPAKHTGRARAKLGVVQRAAGSPPATTGGV